MKSVVIGLGEFGYAAAIALAESGAEVIAIDRKMSLVEKIKDQVTLAVCMDSSKVENLEAHDLSSVDVLIAAIGRDFEAQVLTVAHASKLAVPRIVARALTPIHDQILRVVGAHEVLNPEENAARRLVQGLLVLNVAEYFELSEGFSFTEVAVPPGARGRSLIDLELRNKYKLNVVGIKRPVEDEDGLSYVFDPVPHPEDVLKEGELLAMVGNDLALAQFLAAMDG